MDKFLLNDKVEYCGLEGTVTRAFVNDDNLACVEVTFMDGEMDIFLADGRLDTRFKRAALTLVRRAPVAKTFYVNIYKKAGSATLVPGSKLFESKEVAEAKGKSSTDSLYVSTVAISITL